jgi:hypothetical protein
METPLILADRILELIRSAGVTRVEASCALAVAQNSLPCMTDITFVVHDEPSQPEDAA